MNPEQLKLLKALDYLIEVNPNLVTDEQYNIYNELLDLADSLNIAW